MLDNATKVYIQRTNSYEKTSIGIDPWFCNHTIVRVAVRRITKEIIDKY